MLLDAIYVFFEVCVALALVLAALWLATKALGWVYELVTGELSERRAEERERRGAGHGRHAPTPG